MKSLFNKIGMMLILLCSFTGTVNAQVKNGEALKEMLVGKTVKVQGTGVPFYKVTLNADGSFIHCAPTVSCEVEGRWSIGDDGLLIRKYKRYFSGATRSGYVTDTTFSGAKILEISEIPLVALSSNEINNMLVDKRITVTLSTGDNYDMSFTSRGRLHEYFPSGMGNGVRETGKWSTAGSVLTMVYDNWRPSFAPDGTFHYPVVKEGKLVYFGHSFVK